MTSPANSSSRQLSTMLGLIVVMITSVSLFAQSGATYYVSTSGSDSNAGTYSSPWRTIQHAADFVSAGATVYVLGGVYNESVTIPTSGTARRIMSPSRAILAKRP